jgi:hypothetical protein
MILRRAVVILAPTLVLACSADRDRSENPSYETDVRPLLEARCQTCHREGGAAPFALDQYDVVKALAPAIAHATRERRMPPWGADETDECRPRFGFKGDLRLTEDEIAMLEKWASIGAPEGERVEDAPPAPRFVEGEIARPDMLLTAKTPFTATGDRDQFRCFVLDPKIAIPSFVNGIAFQPDNASVVHHALLFTDPNRESAALGGEGGSYDCFGGPGVSDFMLLHAWAPGAPPTDLGADLAMPVQEGSLLVLQIHYHPHGADVAPDRSSVAIRFSEALPKYVAFLALIGNFEGLDSEGNGLMPGMNDRSASPEFRIPANVSTHIESQRFTIPARVDDFEIPNLRVLAVGSHMHYVGTDLKLDVTHDAPKAGEPKDECLLETPRWDFNWQRSYVYDTSIENAPELRPGDTVQIRCTYDNTLENPFVGRALSELGLDAPREVFLGEQTLDEMCLVAMMAAFPNPLLAP